MHAGTTSRFEYGTLAPRRRRRRWWALAIAAVALAYTLLPALAGALAWGDRRGPRLYPQGLHTTLYVIGWEAAGREGKPRESARARARPWFYGW